MKDGIGYIAQPSECHYLPDQMWQLEYRLVTSLSRERYSQLVQQGWRRFGDVLFRPRCAACHACQPIRVLVNRFQPDRSQRRVAKANGETQLVIGEPKIDKQRLDLYLKHHAHHAETKGWPFPDTEGSLQHIYSMINGPLPIQEWSYYVAGELVAVSYIDEVSDGFSGVYFYHDPDHRKLSLGNWICLSLIEQAAERALPYVYFGYYIKNCRSMEYKGRFLPAEVLAANGKWREFEVTADLSKSQQ